MPPLTLQREWPFAGMLVLSLALGVAIAAGVDAWTSSDEITAVDLLANSAAALLIAAAMVWCGRIMRWQPFERAAHRAAGARPAGVSVDHAPLPALLDAIDIGVILLSPNDRVSYCNPAFLRIWKIPAAHSLMGAAREALLAAMGGTLARPDERARLLLCAPPDNEPQVKLELPMADGRLVTQHSHPVSDALGARLGHLWLFEDVTVERHHARQLLQLGARDALTGHYNRHRFNEEFERMLADAQRNGTRLALLLFDLDGFKHINSTFGHRAGDATLIRVANVVGGQVRRNEIFARLGGDDFVILTPDAADEAPEALAERLTRSISQTRTEYEGQQLRVTCSCGIAVYPDHAARPDELMARADAAMYEAKEAGKNTWRRSRAPTDAAGPALSPLSPDARIRHALDNHLLVLHYQGIYSTQQRTLKHYEVLLRIRDADSPGALLLTGDFIAMAEKCGRILEIDRWVLGQAIQKLAADSAIPALAVNISGRSLDDDTLPAFIAGELKRCAVPARRLLVELTETAAVSDMHDAQRFIEALQALGCGVSLDDFGTGFSSFGYLKHLNVDAIKIDGLFIRNLWEDHENQLFVRAIVSVARGLHKTTIAECVEDEASLKILAALGVDYVQGFHLERPQQQPATMPAHVVGHPRPSQR